MAFAAKDSITATSYHETIIGRIPGLCAAYLEHAHDLAVTFFVQVIKPHENDAGETKDPVQRACHEEKTVQHLGREGLDGRVLGEADVFKTETGQQTAESRGGFNAKRSDREDDAFGPAAGPVFEFVGDVDEIDAVLDAVRREYEAAQQHALAQAKADSEARGKEREALERANASGTLPVLPEEVGDTWVRQLLARSAFFSC